MKWITASDIKKWADVSQRQCQDTLPELVGRLILAHTINSLNEFDFPCGDSVSSGGWDGRLNTSVQSPYLPKDQSGWEIGAGKSVKKKADDDYSLRVSNPLGVNPAETTFVFVTPRGFTNRNDWIKSKKKSGDWKDVRVVAADTLEQWISITPAVGLWLARKLGKAPSEGIQEIENFWDEWSSGSNPTLSPELIIGGRYSDLENIQNWIQSPASIKEVQGDHPQESFAFLYSAILMLPDSKKQQALSRCVLVENKNQMRQLIQTFSDYPLIIAAPGECLEIAHLAKNKGHHVFISVDASVVAVRGVMRLGRPKRDVVENILKQTKSEAEAEKISRDSGRSIPVLRRQLFQAGAVSAPSWCAPQSASVLLPALFLNAWDESMDGDRQIVEIVSGMSYEDFIKSLSPFLSIDDAPVRKVGTVWMMKSPLDALYLLRSHITESQLNNFENALLKVLSQIDPKYGLDPEKRWAAAIYGKANLHSEWIRKGLAESLVLVTIYGDNQTSTLPTQIFADRVVNNILKNASGWQDWASMKDKSPLLAEAAPSVFVKMVDHWIIEKPETFKELMKDSNSIFAECLHSGLLWALEAMAWSRDYFSQTIDLLIKLADIDEGDGWNNRAVNSLRDIFHPSLPQTHVSPEERILVLRRIADQKPELVWKFAKNYYTDGSISESYRFRWRETGGVRRGLEREHQSVAGQYIQGLRPILQELAGHKSNVVESLDDFTRLPNDIQKKIISSLEQCDASDFSNNEKLLLLTNLREALHWINSYGNSEQKNHVSDLNGLLEKFTPEDIIDQFGWLLCTPWPVLPDAEPDKYEDSDKLIKSKQKVAARHVLDGAEIDKILDFSKGIMYPGVLGYSLASAVTNEEDSVILDAILERAVELPLLIECYARGRVEQNGKQWIDDQVQRHKGSGVKCGFLYLGLPENLETWIAVESMGEATEDVYWQYARGYSNAEKVTEAQFAVKKMLKVKRPRAALQVAGDPLTDIPSTLLHELLLQLLEDNQGKIGQPMDEFYLGHIFDKLYKKQDLTTENMISLEWAYAMIFDGIKRYTSSPMIIHQELQKNPRFFAQLMSYIYLRDDKSVDPSNEGLSEKILTNRARVGREVIDSFRLIPGMTEDGSIDEQSLEEWIDIAKAESKKTKHSIGCSIQIANLLAHAPNDGDGLWPHRAVRNQIERLEDQIMDNHIPIEIYNSRGGSSRGIDEGGDIERSLSEKYRKIGEALKVQWPRTSAILQQISESYDQDAKGLDIDADLRDFRWS